MINNLECKEFIGRCYASDIGIFGQRRADQTSGRPAWMSSRSAARVLELEGGPASALRLSPTTIAIFGWAFA